MKRLLVLLAACVTSVVSLADGATTRLIQPTGSELKLVEFKNKNELLAKFSGKIWVTGTFYGRWPAGPLARLNVLAYNFKRVLSILGFEAMMKAMK